MKRCKKKIVSVLLVLICLCCQVGCSKGEDIDPSQGGMLTKSQVQEDRTQVIEHLEEIHPFFLLEKNQEEYETAKKQYLKATKKEMTLYEFQEATSIYLSSINDAHTGIQWKSYGTNPILQIETCYQDGKTYLCEDGENTAVWIEEIGGISIQKIYQKIDLIRAEENINATIVNRDNLVLYKNVLKSCGAKIEKEKVEVLLSNGRKETYGFGEKRIKKIAYGRGENNWYMDGDIFVVDFNECTVDEKIDSIASELENAISNGCTKVIIDARGNDGGNSAACERLLNAMQMIPPEYSETIIRYSPQAAKKYEYAKTDGIETIKGWTKGVKLNKKINLVVLSDRGTFSSATMLCVWVRDGKLGTIIGEGSMNAPTAYGDIFMHTLKNSKLGLTVSYRRYVRPDKTNTEDMLIPDIETSAADAYAKAVEYLDTIE